MNPLTRKILLLSIISYVLISANAGGYSIYMLDEARNAQCAREMWQSGDLIVPTFNGELRTDKPPLHYYFMMAAYTIFGVSPFAARFFSGIFGVLTVLLTFWFTTKFLNDSVANIATLVLLSSLGFIFQFHLAVPDPHLIFFVAAGLMCLFCYQQLGRHLYLIISYSCIGLGTLAKGPIAIVIPALSLFTYLLLSRKLSWSQIMKFKPFTGLAIILLIAMPWYLAVHMGTDGAWTKGFFLNHNINRFASPKEGHGGSVLLPSIFVILTMLPLSVFLPQALTKALKDREKPVIIFSVAVLLSVVIFFSIASTKLPGYVSLLFPFAAIVVGYWLQDWESLSRKKLLPAALIFCLVSAGLLWGTSIFIPKTKGIESLGELSWFFLPGMLLSLAAVILISSNRIKAGILAMAISFMITHQLSFYFIFPRVDAKNPVRKTASLVQKAANLVHYKRINQAYIWLLGQEVPAANSIVELQRYMDDHPETLVISRKRYLPELEGLKLQELAREIDLFDNTTTVILGQPK